MALPRVFDFSFPIPVVYKSDINMFQNITETFLKGLNAKSVFSLEKGKENGTLHYQGISDFKKGQNFTQMKKKWIEFGKLHEIPIHIAPAGNPDALRKYVVKEDSHISGPYYINTNPEEFNQFDPELDEEAKRVMETCPFPWQSKAKDMLMTPDPRRVDWIWDDGFNKGKSTFSAYMEDYHNTTAFDEMKGVDMRAAVGQLPNKSLRRFIIDIPATRETNISERDLYSTIEHIKNGRLWATKGVLSKNPRRRFKRPAVLVLSNRPPKRQCLAPDRWNVWKITSTKDLIKDEST